MLPSIFRILIKYIYSGTIILDEHQGNDLFEILAAADQFLLYELLEYLQDYIIQNRTDWIKRNLMSPADYCHKVRPYKQLFPKNLQEDLLCYYLANDQPKSANILPPRVSPIKIDSTIIGPQHTALIARWLDNEPTIRHGIQYNFTLLFRASRDGYSINALKQQCACKGPTILVLKLRDSGQLIGGYNPIGWKSVKFGRGRGTKESFIFTLGDGTSPYDARISRIAYDNCDTEIDDLIWIGPKFGKGPDLWVRMNADQSGEARKGTYESSILETEGRFRWIECEIFSLMKK
ncbi:unnamed protein product [Rhizophagus irregularis]|nr:unnamed protein product [Rhizophagus irregularis]